MKTICIFLACTGALIAQDSSAAARANAERAKERVLQDLQERTRVVSGQIVSGAIIKGAPYAAEAVTETIQTMTDGNRIVQRSSSKEYRDSEGRERREETSSMGAIFITDPIAKVSYTLHPDSRTAEKQMGAGRLYVSTAAPVTTGKNLYAGKSFFFVGSNRPQVVEFNSGGGESPAKKESLGTRQTEGVMANGTRTTSTIPAGSIGNERPIDIVDEQWYSPDLQLNVMTSHKDPRSGETTVTLTNIQRIEQVRSLFEIPGDYKINAQPQAFHFTVDRTF